MPLLPLPLAAGPAVMSMVEGAGAGLPLLASAGWRSVRLSEVKLFRVPLPLPLGVLAPDVGEGGVGDIDVAMLFRNSRAYGGSGCSVITERCRTGERNCALAAAAAEDAVAVAADAAGAVVGDDKETLSDISDSLELSGLVRQEESLEKLLASGCGCCCENETAAV